MVGLLAARNRRLLRTSAGGAYAAQAQRYARLLKTADTTKLASSPGVVADTIVRAVRAMRPRTRYATGGGARSILLLRKILSDRMFDRLIWRVSQGWSQSRRRRG